MTLPFVTIPSKQGMTVFGAIFTRNHQDDDDDGDDDDDDGDDDDDDDDDDDRALWGVAPPFVMSRDTRRTVGKNR